TLVAEELTAAGQGGELGATLGWLSGWQSWSLGRRWASLALPNLSSEMLETLVGADEEDEGGWSAGRVLLEVGDGRGALLAEAWYASSGASAQWSTNTGEVAVVLSEVRRRVPTVAALVLVAQELVAYVQVTQAYNPVLGKVDRRLPLHLPRTFAGTL